MPHMPKIEKDWPGYDADPFFPTINVLTEGGSLDGPYSEMDFKGLIVEDAEIPSFKVAVRLSDGAVKPLVILQEWVTKESTYDESERYARALANGWRIEVYTFDRWENFPKKHWWSRSKQKAVYRFTKAYNLVAQPGEHRWQLAIGGQTEIGAGGRNVLPNRDSWDTACAEVEAAADSFHRIVDLFPEEVYQGRFDGPKKAVEVSRAEARRVAALGQQLEGIEDPGQNLDETIEQTRGQLEALRIQVLEAVRLVSEVQLDLPEIFPSIVREAGQEDLAGIRFASRELSS